MECVLINTVEATLWFFYLFWCYNIFSMLYDIRLNTARSKVWSHLFGGLSLENIVYQIPIFSRYNYGDYSWKTLFGDKNSKEVIKLLERLIRIKSR